MKASGLLKDIISVAIRHVLGRVSYCKATLSCPLLLHSIERTCFKKGASLERSEFSEIREADRTILHKR